MDDIRHGGGADSIPTTMLRPAAALLAHASRRLYPNILQGPADKSSASLPPNQMTPMAIAGQEIYHKFLFPVSVCLSLVCATIVFCQILKKKPRGLFSREPVVGGPGAPSRLFDMLVLILAGFQMYLFGALVAFLPVAWLFPHIKLVGRLDISWAYRPGPNRTDNIVSLVNYLLVVPAIDMESLWHGWVAYLLYLLIARRQPPENLHQHLKPATIAVIVAVIIKTGIALLGLFKIIKNANVIVTIVTQAVLFFVVCILYGKVVLALWVPGAVRSSSIKIIRDRLLALCGMLVVHLACRAVVLGMGMTGLGPPLPLMIFSHTALALRGVLDSLVLGKLCGNLCSCWGHRSSQQAVVVRRQTSDDRIRMGSSVAMSSLKKAGRLSSSLTGIKVDLLSSSPSTASHIGGDSSFHEILLENYYYDDDSSSSSRGELEECKWWADAEEKEGCSSKDSTQASSDIESGPEMDEGAATTASKICFYTAPCDLTRVVTLQPPPWMGPIRGPTEIAS